MRRRQKKNSYNLFLGLTFITVFASMCLVINQVSKHEIDTYEHVNSNREVSTTTTVTTRSSSSSPIHGPLSLPSRQAPVLSQFNAVAADGRFIQFPMKGRNPIEVKKWAEILKKRRRLLTLWNGSIPLSDPKHPARFPTYLKNLPLHQWKKKDRAWLNLTHYPWPNEKSCGRFTVKFPPPGSLPIRGLASFPSSGNSWFRYLLDSATGLFTGSMYNDTSLQRAGMYGEMVPWNSGLTLLQKTHGFTSGAFKQRTYEEQVEASDVLTLHRGGILLIRNPFYAIISHRHLDYSGHTGHAPPTQFVGKNWDNFVEIKTQSWLDFNSIWIEHSKPGKLKIVYYDLLKENPLEELLNALSFFEPDVIPNDLDQRLHCLVAHLDGRMIRRNKALWKNEESVYSHKQIVMIRDALDKLSSVLLINGFQGVPAELYRLPT